MGEREVVARSKCESGCEGEVEVGDRTTITSVRSLEITISGLYDRTALSSDRDSASGYSTDTTRRFPPTLQVRYWSAFHVLGSKIDSKRLKTDTFSLCG